MPALEAFDREVTHERLSNSFLRRWSGGADGAALLDRARAQERRAMSGLARRSIAAARARQPAADQRSGDVAAARARRGGDRVRRAHGAPVAGDVAGGARAVVGVSAQLHPIDFVDRERVGARGGNRNSRLGRAPGNGSDGSNSGCAMKRGRVPWCGWAPCTRNGWHRSPGSPDSDRSPWERVEEADDTLDL